MDGIQKGLLSTQIWWMKEGGRVGGWVGVGVGGGCGWVYFLSYDTFFFVNKSFKEHLYLLITLDLNAYNLLDFLTILTETDAFHRKLMDYIQQH